MTGSENNGGKGSLIHMGSKRLTNAVKFRRKTVPQIAEKGNAGSHYHMQKNAIHCVF